MISLGASQALEGSATTATKVTYTVTGAKMSNASPPVVTHYQVLAQGQVASSAASIYTPGATVTALISSINLMNTTTTTTQTVKLYLEGTTAAHQIAVVSIPAGGFAVYEDGAGWQVYSASGIQLAPAGLTVVSSYLTATSTLTSATAKNLVNLALPAGKWHICCQALVSVATTAGVANLALTTTTASMSSSLGQAQMCSYVSESTVTHASGVAFDAVVTPTTSTTYYLNAEASAAGKVYANGKYSTATTKASGMLAIKIG